VDRVNGVTSDFRADATKEQEKDPLWKVRVLIDHLNKKAKDMWVPGKWVAIDEQTIGFQGASGMKVRISYKRGGDGFQCNAICDRGFTYSFSFRHGNPPDLGPEFKHLELSPPARRVIWLAQRLPNSWSHVFMDNLFNSVKLFTGLYQVQTLAHGVAQTHGRGLPPSVIQKEEPNVKKADKLRGTTKASRLVYNPTCPDVLAVSTYDTKSVHILSTAADSVKWMAKKKKVWDGEKKADMDSLCLNVIDEYNKNMNGTDIADQLRGVYRPDHWMRHRKWWWAYFMWAIGVAGVNGYKIYEVLYDDEKKEGRINLPAKWTHAEFLEELVSDLLIPEQSKKHVDLLRQMEDNNLASSVNLTCSFRTLSDAAASVSDEYEETDLSCRSGMRAYLKKKKTTYITRDRMDASFFKNRLDGLMHDWVHALEKSHCQLCYHMYTHEMDELQQEA
jgi:hypothetical protein